MTKQDETRLALGDAGEAVVCLQKRIGRIACCFPGIPKVPAANGIYDRATAASVAALQRLFALPKTGEADAATREKIAEQCKKTEKLLALYAEGIPISELEKLFRHNLRQGDKGTEIRLLQYYLDFLAHFNPALPKMRVDGEFGPGTAQALRRFQEEYGLPPDGIAGRKSWEKLLLAYADALCLLPDAFLSPASLYYPGYFITSGANGAVVLQLQQYLSTIAENNQAVPHPDGDGYFGEKTQQAVAAVQRLAGLPEFGSVGPLSWNAILNLYNELR